MVWCRLIVLHTSCLLCMLVRIWPARWSIQAWRQQKNEQYTFLCRVRHFFLSLRYFSLWHTAAHPLPVTPCFLFPEAHILSVSVVRQQDSPLWLAVCDCRGEGAGTNLAWVLPENAKSQTSLQPNYKGEIQARLTYQFPLGLHEGHNLTCVYQSKHGTTEEKTIHIPRYCEFNTNSTHHISTPACKPFQMRSKHASFISDFSADITSVKVLNHTTPLQSRYGGEPVIHRLALQEHHQKQKVLLRVEGKVPEYDLICKRWCILYYRQPK